MKKIRIRRATPDDADTLRALHTLTLPSDEHEDYAEGQWWLGLDGDQAVAFLGVRELPNMACGNRVAYFSRVGVLYGYRGHRLMKRLMACMLRYLKAEGMDLCISSTYANPESATGFIRAGWKLYRPVYPWGAEGTCYWWKDLR